jgi:hypothetical protein
MSSTFGRRSVEMVVRYGYWVDKVRGFDECVEKTFRCSLRHACHNSNACLLIYPAHFRELDGFVCVRILHDT